ncbi:MAG TPA: ATP-binding cassette domain-containing protein [Anaerolineae bacterium]|nr:ATP-binding cassette domain-containing protein [Anaerolineae bacterium]
MGDVSLRMQRVSKRYPGVQALKSVDFDCEAGEIHALVGGNGSGKSTLLGIASGAITADAGRVELLGDPLTTAHPAAARRMGLATVYQDNSLVPDLTVAQNLYLAARDGNRPTVRNLRAWARERMGDSGLEMVDPDAQVGALPAGQRQLVEIIKALLCEPKVLLLDEPTTALSLEETDRLQGVIRKAANEGVAVVYVSHRLREVLELATRVSVLRDGQLVATYPRVNLSETEIITAMIGAPVEMEFPVKAGAQGGAPEAVISVAELSGANFGPVAFEVRRGEILGLAGAEGNGQREMLRALAGAEPSTGSVKLGGENVMRGSPHAALQAGVMLLSGDRAGESIFPLLGVSHNMLIQVVDRFCRRGLLVGTAERDAALNLIELLEIATPSLEKPIAQLSGGNQQKTVVGRTLIYPAKLVCVDEPTQGVDVKARLDIYIALRSRAAEGIPIIVKSADAMELAGLCDRVLVISRGQVVRELEGHELTEANIVGSFVSTDTRRSPGAASHSRVMPAARQLPFLSSLLSPDWLPVAVIGLVLLLLGAYASLRSPLFLSAANLRYVMLTAAPFAVVGLGQLCALLVGGFDISVAATASLTMCLLTVVASRDTPAALVVPGVVLCLIIGGLVGLANGAFVRAVGVSPFVATIATMSVVQGLALVVRPVFGGTISTGIQQALTGGIGSVPVVFLALVFAAIAADMWLHRTGAGLKTRATGFLEEAARRNGVATSRLHLQGYVLCSILAACAGLVLASQIGVGNPRGGDTLLMAAFTSPFLGGASLFGGRGSFVGTLLGALFIAVIMNAFTLLKVPAPIGVIVSGLLTLVTITLYSRGAWWDRLVSALRTGAGG